MFYNFDHFIVFFFFFFRDNYNMLLILQLEPFLP